MKTRKVIEIRCNRRERARKAQLINNIKTYIGLYCITFTVVVYGLMTSTILN